MGCPTCGAELSFEDTGKSYKDYNLAKGIVGETLLGTPGALSGFEDKKIVKCTICGCEYTLESYNKKSKMIKAGDPIARYKGRRLRGVKSVPCSSMTNISRAKKIIIGYEEWSEKKYICIWHDYELDDHLLCYDVSGRDEYRLNCSYKQKKIDIYSKNSERTTVFFENEGDVKNVVDTLQEMIDSTLYNNRSSYSLHVLTEEEERKEKHDTVMGLILLIIIIFAVISAFTY